jgi:hypothetical protein
MAPPPKSLAAAQKRQHIKTKAFLPKRYFLTQDKDMELYYHSLKGWKTLLSSAEKPS